MSGDAEVQYVVLGDVAQPYLLARVRWPDVCQAISAGRPAWQDDPGLFDLPYDPSSAAVTAEQAVTVAGGWGVRLNPDEPVVPSVSALIRRMPADWSNLSPAEKRAWGLEFVHMGRRPVGHQAAGSAESPGRVAASAPRRTRWGWRRRTVTPSPSPLVLHSQELNANHADASSDGFVRSESVELTIGSMLPIVILEPPVGVASDDGGGPADGPDVIDLRDVTPDLVPFVDESATS